jgi:GNAT superfamily N-acetyltransferase
LIVLLTPHYDVVEWLEPDWVFDTAKRSFARGLLRRPSFDLEIWKTDGGLWPLFEPHHYLKLPRMVGAAYYVGTVDGELAVHLAVSSMNKGPKVEARACRLVTMPEWQGAGVGFRFLNEIWPCRSAATRMRVLLGARAPCGAPGRLNARAGRAYAA